MEPTQRSQMLTTDLLDLIDSDLVSSGFSHIKNYLIKSDITDLSESIESVERNYYNELNLNRRSVYQSDNSDTRKSYAIMAAEVNPNREFIPAVTLIDSVVKKHLKYFNCILSALNKEETPLISRSLINFQSYLGSSKPVPEHFDGDILDATSSDYGSLTINEALVPRYVMVIVVENENTQGSSGICLRDTKTDEVFSPLLKAGDAIIFDNIKFRHSVPMLAQKRKIIGFRNFDFNPYLFIGGEICAPDGWTVLTDKTNHGILRQMSSDEAMTVTQYFNQFKWPLKRAKWLKDNGIF
jgi:hypothetical protein